MYNNVYLIAEWGGDSWRTYDLCCRIVAQDIGFPY